MTVDHKGGEALYNTQHLWAVVGETVECLTTTCVVRNSDESAMVIQQRPKVKLVYCDLDGYDLICEESAKADVYDQQGSVRAIVESLSQNTTHRSRDSQFTPQRRVSCWSMTCSIRSMALNRPKFTMTGMTLALSSLRHGIGMWTRSCWPHQQEGVDKVLPFGGAKWKMKPRCKAIRPRK